MTRRVARLFFREFFIGGTIRAVLPDLQTHGPLFEAVVAGRATLVLGPAFAHGIEALDLWPFVEKLRESQPEIPGWDGLHLSDRVELCRRALGTVSFAARLAEHLPTAGALRAHVGPLHRALLGLPFPVIATTELDDLARATLAELGTPFETAYGDEWRAPLPAERRVVKLRGDLLLDAPTGEPEARRLAALRPTVTAALRRRAARGPVLLYGFSPQDPQVTWLTHEVFEAPTGGGMVLLARQASGLWVDTWRARGLDVMGAATVADLEQQVLRFAEAVTARRSPAAEDAAAYGALTRDVSVRMATGVAEIAPWAAMHGQALQTVSDPEEVSDALRGLEALARAGHPVAPGAAARGADILSRLGHTRRAEDALRLALSLPGAIDPEGEASLGRTLVRQGHFERAQLHLERALEHGEADNEWARADELAWLSRCILDRIDRLRRAGRQRAVMETIAAFLSGQATRLSLTANDPGEDDALRWTAYYVNLRLGQLMALAGEMARASASIYATQAVELLTRAVEMQPQKPDPYRALQPLLGKTGSGAHDARRWSALVAAAPPAVQRKLTAR